MEAHGLVQIGLYGTRFVLLVGGTELFIVKRVDLQRQHIRLQRWPSEYMSACDFKGFDKPWFKPDAFGIICRNGCLAKVRGTFTRDEIVKRVVENIIPVGGSTNPILTEAFGRPAYVDGACSYILTGENYVPKPASFKRNHALEISPIRLSKFGYLIHPTIPELIGLLETHAGILCDPFAMVPNAKKKNVQFVHVPLI